MKNHFILFLKGMAMGVANVIPGVSGGTIALITEIYEDLIHSLKSINIHSFKLILNFKFKEFIEYTNFYFLLSIFGGSIVSVFSIASLFKYLFEHYPVFIWAFFFGLILASIFFVGKRITKWSLWNVVILLLGASVAFSLSFISPTSQNENLFYVFICGIIGISGMMLPGLSGSFILILMGNYQLLMVDAITDLEILLLSVFILGSIFGLISFSRVLSWVFKSYKDATLALLTGFIFGSLNIIWPWKKELKYIIVSGEKKILSYERYFPNQFNSETIIAFTLLILGFLIVCWMERFSSAK
tara:strand:- start:1998 stop:2897 length:900 start_codon:yes stop_codon:yes gene_type:complete